MKKSMYSLILSDGVVEKIDRLAYKQGTNRSNLINQILAEYVSYVTPEKRLSQIFSALEGMLFPSENFKNMLSASDSIMSLRSSIDFKYNPSVKYSVELYKNDKSNIGQIKVSMRTQNYTLISYLIEFYKLWAKIESEYIGTQEYSYENDKFTRKLKLAQNSDISDEKLGINIANYIKTFDNAMKIFFYYIDNVSYAFKEILKIYKEYLSKADVII